MDNKYIEKTGYTIEVRNNEDFRYEEAKNFPDGFLYFPYNIELDIDNSISLPYIINDVNNILTFLWENQYAGIASCAFENQLVKNGGYKRKDIPWI